MVNARNKSRKSKSGIRRRGRKMSMSVKRVTQIAKAAVARSAEVKCSRFTQNGTLYSPANQLASSYAVAGDLWCLTPHTSFCSITEGTDEDSRIGTKIKIKSIRLKVNVWPNAYDAINNPTPTPFYLKFWIFSVKYSSQLSDVQSVISSGFLNNGSSSGGITGNLNDMTAPVNTNYVTLKKTFIRKLGMNEVGTGGIASTGFYANNDFHMTSFLNIDVSRYCRKNISFNDNSGTASTAATWMYVEAIPFNNNTSAANGIGNQPGQYSMTMSTYYTDS